MSKFIGLDFGTSFIKGGVLDLDSFEIRHIRRQPCPDAIPGLPARFYEIDPRIVVERVRTLLGELLAVEPDCEGVVVCSQMHCLILCTETGEPRSNIITWRDQRILEPHPSGQGTFFDHLLSQISEGERQQLGRELVVSRPLCYLYWMAQTGHLPPGKLIPAMFTDWVIANLCGQAPSIEPTNASGHGALNLERMEWHYPLIERVGLGHLHWPKIQKFGAMVGEIAIAGKRLRCYTPVGDHECALVGAFLRQDELSLNISTGSQVSQITPVLRLGDYQTRPFFDDTFINTITGVPAGRALTPLVNLMTEVAQLQGVELADPWQTIAEAAERVEQTDLQVNLCFYESLGRRSGFIENMQEHNISVGHLFHAAFQTMAENYWRSALTISPEQGWSRLVFSGGVAQKIALLRTLIQRQFGGVDYRLCASSEDTLLGLMALALAASGKASSVAQAVQRLADSELRVGQ